MKKAVSVLLMLITLGTVVLFAVTTDGVEWNYSESTGVTTFRNTTSNDLYVMVWVNGRPYNGGHGFLAAGETKKIPACVTNIRASRIKVSTKW